METKITVNLTTKQKRKFLLYFLKSVKKQLENYSLENSLENSEAQTGSYPYLLQHFTVNCFMKLQQGSVFKIPGISEKLQFVYGEHTAESKPSISIQNQNIQKIARSAGKTFFHEIQVRLENCVTDQSLRTVVFIPQKIKAGEILKFVLSDEDDAQGRELILTHSFTVRANKPVHIIIDPVKNFIEHVRIQQLCWQRNNLNSLKLPLFFQNFATKCFQNPSNNRSTNDTKGLVSVSIADKFTSAHSFAEALLFKGEYQEALEIYGQLLKQENIWSSGAPTPNSIALKGSIADILSRQGKYRHALNIYNQLLKEMENTIDLNSSESLTIRNNMAVVQTNAGQYNEALKTLLTVQKMQETSIGNDHPWTLITKHNMALVLQKQGKYVEAMKASQELLTILKHKMGYSHPNTLAIKHNIGILLDIQGHYCEALKMFLEVFDVEEHVLGPSHPNTITTHHNIGSVLESQGKYSEAVDEYKDVLRLEEKLLGKNHPNCLATKCSIASVLGAQGKHREAIKDYVEVLEGQSKVLGRDHPDTLLTINNIGWCYLRLGECSKSGNIAAKVMDARQRILGVEHPDFKNSEQLFKTSVSSCGRSAKSRFSKRWFN